MKGIKKHLVTLLSAVLMMTSLGLAPALADETPLGNDDFNIVVNKKLNPKDLTLDLKIKLEDKNTTTPKVVDNLSQVFKEDGKEKTKLNLVEDKTDEYELVVSKNGVVDFELNYSKEVKAAEGESEAIMRDEKHNFKVNVTEIEEQKMDEPMVEEPAVEEPTVEEPTVEEPTVEEPTVEEPVVEEPAVEEPTVEEPAVEEPAVEEPVVEEPTVVDGESEKAESKKENKKPGFFASLFGLNDADVTIVPSNIPSGQPVKTDEVIDFLFTVDFKDDDSTNKKLEIELPLGLEFSNYPVITTPRPNSPETEMTGIVKGFVESVEAPTLYYNGHYGKLVYNFVPTTEKAEIRIGIVANKDVLPSDTADKIDYQKNVKATAFKNGVNNSDDNYLVHIKDTAILRPYVTEGNQYPISKTYDVGYTGEVVGPGITAFARDSKNQEYGLIVEQFSVELHYPVGAKFKHMKANAEGYSASNIVADDSTGTLKFDLDQKWITARVFPIFDVSSLPVGEYKSTQGYKINFKFKEGNIERELKNSGDWTIKVEDLSLAPNKLNLKADDVRAYGIGDTDYEVLGPILSISNGPKKVTDQYIKFTIDPNFEVGLVRMPRGEGANVSQVVYRTNIGGAVDKIATGSQLINKGIYTEISSSSVGLGPNEYFTYVEGYMGDFDVDYRPYHPKYIKDGVLKTIGKLKNGVPFATVDVETFSKDAGGVVDANSIVQAQGKVIDGTTSTFKDGTTIVKPNSAPVILQAGTSKEMTFNLTNDYYLYSNTNGITNPTLYLLELGGYKFDESTLQIFDESASPLSFTTQRRPLSDGSGTYLTIDIQGQAGTFFKSALKQVTVKINIKAYLDASLAITQDKIAMWKPNTKFAGRHNSFPDPISDTLDLDQDGTNFPQLIPVKASQLTIVSKESLMIDTFIVPEGGSRQDAYDAALGNAVGFTPGTMATYNVEILNNRKDTVNEVTTYLPVPKDGIDFGSDFQDNPFGWNMTLKNVPKIKVLDKDGNDVTTLKEANYQITYSDDASNSGDYRTATYNTTISENTKMIRIVNDSNTIEAGERALLTFDYKVDEIDATKAGNINDFKPYYYVSATGTAGWATDGTRVGAELVNGEVSGYVFEDTNANGVKDSGEPAISGRTITLCKLDAAGTACVETKTTTTASDGVYKFEDLTNGNFKIDFNTILNSGEEFTRKGAGSVVDPIGTNKGLALNIDSTKKNAKEVNVGIVKYDATTLAVNVAPKNVDILKTNGTNSITKDLTSSLTIVPSNFDDIKAASNSIVWSSSDTSVLTVSNGLIQGVSVGTAVVTVTITDMYGNTASNTFNVTVKANNAPVLTLTKASDEVEVNTTANLAAYISSVSDVEDAGLSASDVIISPTSIDTTIVGKTYAVEYLVKDSHLNETKKVLNLKVVDKTAPVITANATASWNNSTPKTEAQFLTEVGYSAIDNSNGTVTVSTDFDTKLTSAVQAKPGTVNVTITAEDPSGNKATHVVAVTLIDDVKPVLTADTELTINSGEVDINQLSFYAAAHVNAVDNSGSVNVTSNFATVITDQDTPDAVGKDVTITATDAVGNTTSVTVKVFVKDTTPPTFVSAQNVTINTGDADMTAAEFLTASAPSATDNDNHTPTFTSDFATVITEQNTPDATGKTVTITATDAAGNASTKTVKVTIVDTTKPVIVNAQNVTINTNDTDMTAVGFLVSSGATATDNDGLAPTLSSDFATVITDQNTPDAVGKDVTITATDAAGNTETVVVKVFVKDTTDPSFVSANNVEINSGDTDMTEAEFLAASAPVATDNDDQTPTFTSDFATVITDQNTPDATGKTVTITATDTEGNSSTKTVIVTVVDTTKPVIKNHKDVTINTGDTDMTAAEFLVASGATATDNDNAAPTVTSDFATVITDQDAPDAVGKDVTITATDIAGNVQTVTVKVFVKDTTKPIISGQLNVSIDSDSHINAAQFLTSSAASATDNDGFVPTLTSDFDAVITDQDTPDLLGKTVTITATDKAGNSSSVTVLVTIIDTTKPTISNAKDVVIESDSPITEADFITASDYTVTDNNTVAPTVTTDFTAVMVDQLTPDATGKDVTITATDAAGNVQTQIVKVTVKDTTAPVLTVVKNKVVIKEVSSLTYADLAAEINATFTDNGDMAGVNVTVIDFENVKSDTVGTYTFKLQVTDKAGNESNIQTITVKVANEYNPTNAESINGHDFKILIDDVNDANIKKLAEAVAHDVSVDPEVEIPLIVSHNITTVGNKQEVVFTTANGSVLKVQADVYDAGNIVPGKGSIYANNFDMKMKNMNVNSVIAAAGVEAFDAAGNPVALSDIKLVSALPTTAGFHNFIFEANGLQVTVLGHVTARYQVVGHDVNMTMAEFKAFKANGTIEQEIIKRAEGKVINLDTGEIAELANVDYHTADITKLAPGKYDIVLNYTIDGDFIDEETSSTFGLNKIISKHVNLNITADSNSGNGSGNDNGTGNGTGNGTDNGTNTGSNNGALPSAGMAVDATPILIGGAILVLGLFLFLLNKKDKKEEQK